MDYQEEIQNKLPEEFRKYFWDCEFTEISFASHRKLVAERILNYGNIESIQWLLSKINKQVLNELIKTSRNLTKKTKNYWTIVLSNAD